MKKIVIVGGGLGGLTAGAYFAKAGFTVTLLEQHYKIGGFSTTFSRKKINTDVGLHLLAGLDSNSMFHKIISDLEIDRDLKFVRLDDFYTANIVGKDFNVDFTVKDDLDSCVASLTLQFPLEENFIKSFFEKMINLRTEIKNFYGSYMRGLINPQDMQEFKLITYFADKTLSDELIECSDPKLWLILTNSIGFYNEDPFTLSFLSYAAGHGSYFLGGAYYIAGGSQKLSDALAAKIIDNGGEIIKQALVTRIAWNSQEVQVEKVRYRKQSQEFEIEADFVICNNSPGLVFSELLDPPISNKMTSLLNKAPLSTSVSMLHLFLNQGPGSYGNNHHYTNYVRTNLSLEEVKDKFLHKKINTEDYLNLISGFAITDYGVNQTQLNLPPLNALTVMKQDNISKWNQENSNEYQLQKEKLSNELLKNVEDLFPNIGQYVVWKEQSTPLTVRRFNLTPSGAIYGYKLTPTMANHRRPYPLGMPKGLIFASSWVKPGPGFESSMLSGWLAFNEVNRQESIRPF